MSRTDDAIDALSRTLLTSFPADAARQIDRFSGSEAAKVLSELEPAAAARVVRNMSAPIARDAMAAMTVATAAGITAALEAPWAAALFRAVPPDRVEAVLAGVAASHRSAVTRAMQHRAGTAGALLEPAVLSLAPDVAAAFALEQAKHRSVTSRDRVYVAERDGRLVGVVGIADLVVAAPEAKLATLMSADVAVLRHDDASAAVVAHPGWRSWRTLPVVDSAGTLLGVVRYDTVQTLVLDRAPRAASGIGLPVSLAELYWIGLVGITDGIARAVAAPLESDGS